MNEAGAAFYSNLIDALLAKGEGGVCALDSIKSYPLPYLPSVHNDYLQNQSDVTATAATATAATLTTDENNHAHPFPSLSSPSPLPLLYISPGITPVVTLYQNDLPLEVGQAGGWLSPTIM